MKALTYTSYKVHYDLYAEIEGLIAIKSFQMKLAQKDIILLSKFSIAVFNYLAGTYSIDDFNAKIKMAFLQQRQDWEPPQIKDLKLVMAEEYTFIASNNTFIALGIHDKYLEKTMLISSILPPGSNKTSLDISPPPRSLSLYCKQIYNVNNKLDGQPSSLLASMNVCDYKATFSQIHLDFLELGIQQPHLNFKILDANKNEVIPRTFYLQLLNKE